MRKYALFYTAILSVFVFVLAIINLNPFFSDSNAQQRRFGRNLQVLTHVESKEQLQKIMEGIANSLGVKCNYCHNVNNYASDEKETKKKARVMLKMVMTINRDFINWEGAEVVDCYTCHRGQTKPQVKASSK
jgi:photosynthetic reaction center cytochrome c subunit